MLPPACASRAAGLTAQCSERGAPAHPRLPGPCPTRAPRGGRGSWSLVTPLLPPERPSAGSGVGGSFPPFHLSHSSDPLFLKLSPNLGLLVKLIFVFQSFMSSGLQEIFPVSFRGPEAATGRAGRDKHRFSIWGLQPAFREEMKNFQRTPTSHVSPCRPQHDVEVRCGGPLGGGGRLWGTCPRETAGSRFLRP